MKEELLVPANLPEMPLILADGAFLASLASLEKAVSDVAVEDVISEKTAAALLKDATSAGKRLDDARMALKRPFLDVQKAIDAAARDPLTRIDKCKAILKRKMTAYQDHLRAIAAEQERRRLEELRRLQEEKARQDEIARQQAQQGTNALDIDFDDGVQTPVEEQIGMLEFAAAAILPPKQAEGVSYIKKLVFDVTNIEALPSDFVIKTVNEAEIRKRFCHGWRDGDPLPNIPGLVFKIESTVRTNGR